MTKKEISKIDLRLGFVGGGQMAEALMQGLLSRGMFDADRIIAAEPKGSRRAYLKKTYDVAVTADNKEAVRSSEVVVLAVKPQIMSVVLDDIGSCVTTQHLVVSIAAGVKISFLEKSLGSGARVVRVMPNTPALVKAGAAGVSPGSGASRQDLDLVRRIMAAVGVAVSVPEEQLDAVTGLSGSGPAYVFTFLEGLIDAGVREGLPRPVARELAVQTVLGSALMCKESGKIPGELKGMVTSPGGTTIEGLHALEKGAFRSLIMDAVRAATQRSRQLGD